MPAINANKKLLPVLSPTKGVNRFAAREAQPEETCWDALNVLPFDRYGRSRVAQRTGTTKQFATQLSTGTIQALAQTIVPVNPSSFALDETWAYSAGALPAVSAGKWIYHVGATHTTEFNANGDGTVTVPVTASGSGTVSLDYVPTLISQNSCTVKFSLAMQSGSTNGDQNSFRILFNDNLGDVLFQVDIDHGFSGGAGLRTVSSEFTLGNDFTAAGTDFTGDFEFDITPASVAVKFNGTTLVTWTGISVPAFTNIEMIGVWNSTTGTPVFKITQPLTISGPGSGTTRLSKLLAVSGGNVWQGTVQGVTSTITEASNQATPPLSTSALVSACHIFGKAYLVDGSHIVQYDVPTNAVETYTATAGTAPTNVSIACNWRSRLVLAGDSANPQNFYMARTGVPTDWDFSKTDPSAAVAGNLSQAGQIGEPITALIPFTDDIMLIGCTHSLWMIQGDPADGGAITNVSQNMGIVGPTAWCIDPAGRLYFVGTGGLFSVRPPWEMWEPPQLMTGASYNQFFQNLDRGQSIVNLIWDADTHYLYVLATPLDGTTQGTHLAFDSRGGGLWPIQFPVNHGPVSASQFFGDGAAANRTILFGGENGFIRRLGNVLGAGSLGQLAYDDDGTAINAYVVFGPFKPFPEAAMLTGTTIDFGEVAPVDQGAAPTKWNALATLVAGPTAYEVTEGVQGNLHPIAAVPCTLERRQKTFRQRLRGGWFSLKVSNAVLDTYFTFESAVMEFEDAGRNRVRR